MSQILKKIFNFSGEPFDLLNLFQSEPYVFCLESRRINAASRRYSFIGFDPFEIFRSDGKDSLDRLREKFQKYTELAEPNPAAAADSSHLVSPLESGLIGFLSYDLGLKLEDIHSPPFQGFPVPDCLFGFYDCILTIDHLRGKLIITSSGLPEKDRARRKKRARDRLEKILRQVTPLCLSAPLSFLGESAGRFPSPGLLTSAKLIEAHNSESGGRDTDYNSVSLLLRKSVEKQSPFPALKSNFTKKEYLNAISSILEYIRRGDVYQVNLSQRFELSSPRDLDYVRLYRELSRLSEVNFGGYFDAGMFRIVSNSPERFLYLKDRVLTASPMKGTRPRGETPAEDHLRRQELLRSQKDKAELLMITDLTRNDLGKVCEPGSIEVKRLRALERYSTVFQSTSTVQGILRKGLDGFDVLRACFPGGSVTGCPKIEAMKIISSLEPIKRGIYTGTLGYISFSGEMDFNIMIRTVMGTPRKMIFQSGGGIVADSSPQGEYDETLVKTKALRLCLASYALQRKKTAEGQSGKVSMEKGHPRNIIFLDNQFMSGGQELLNTLTPGNIRGKGVFETMRVYPFPRGKKEVFIIPGWKQHLARLKRGLKFLNLKLPMPERDWTARIKDVLRLNHLKSARVRVVVCQESEGLRFCVMAFSFEPIPRAQFILGYKISVCPSPVRRFFFPKGMKSIDYAFFLQAYQRAHSAGYDETLLINPQGEVVDASRSNLFFVKDNVLCSPDLSLGGLPGVTQAIVRKIAKEMGLKFNFVKVGFKDLLCAREIFLTNSVIEIMPVTAIGPTPIAHGKPGPITSQIAGRYRQFVLKQPRCFYSPSP